MTFLTLLFIDCIFGSSDAENETPTKYLGVGTSACTAAARLDSKQVVEHGADKVVVEEPTAPLMSNEEGEDGKTGHRTTAEDDKVLQRRPELKRSPGKNQQQETLVQLAFTRYLRMILVDTHGTILYFIINL